MKSVSVVVNARLQSTRVPQKLVRPFAETTLLEIALEKLNRMDFFAHRFLAVAEPALKALAPAYPNVVVLDRSASAVQRGVNSLTVTFEHYLRVPTEWVFVFNPCLPFVTVEAIREAFDYFQATEHPSYTAVVPTGDWIFDSEGTPLTNADPRNATTNKNRTFFKATHAFHIHNRLRFASTGLLWTFAPHDPHLVPMADEQAVDVDTEAEFRLAEAMWRARRSGESTT